MYLAHPGESSAPLGFTFKYVVVRFNPPTTAEGRHVLGRYLLLIQDQVVKAVLRLNPLCLRHGESRFIQPRREGRADHRIRRELQNGRVVSRALHQSNDVVTPRLRDQVRHGAEDAVSVHEVGPALTTEVVIVWKDPSVAVLLEPRDLHGSRPFLVRGQRGQIAPLEHALRAREVDLDSLDLGSFLGEESAVGLGAGNSEDDEGSEGESG